MPFQTKVPSFGEAGHAQEALLLLRLCACPRITFLLQCVPYNIAPQAFNDSYRDILSTFGRIAGITEELDTADEVTRGRIALPLRHGGQGLIDPSHIADQALVANWAATFTEPIGEIPGTTNRDGSTNNLRPDIRVDGLSSPVKVSL